MHGRDWPDHRYRWAIRETGDAETLGAAVDAAFPGSRIAVDSRDGRFALQLRQKGLLRPLEAAELSDGTLRYLLWVAALLTPRPPSLMVLNEPEASLHPDLLAPLSDLIVTASRDAQTLVVTHATPLAEALDAGGRRRRSDLRKVELVKEWGETKVAGREGPLDEPLWYWPKR